MLNNNNTDSVPEITDSVGKKIRAKWKLNLIVQRRHPTLVAPANLIS